MKYYPVIWYNPRLPWTPKHEELGFGPQKPTNLPIKDQTSEAMAGRLRVKDPEQNMPQHMAGNRQTKSGSQPAILVANSVANSLFVSTKSEDIQDGLVDMSLLESELFIGVQGLFLVEKNYCSEEI